MKKFYLTLLVMGCSIAIFAQSLNGDNAIQNNSPFIETSFNTTASCSVSPASFSASFQLVGTEISGFAFSFTASGLSPASGSLTAIVSGASAADYQVSNDNLNYGSSTTIDYSESGGNIAKLYLRFAPSVAGAGTAIISVSGGGLAAPIIIDLSATAIQKFYSKPSGSLAATSTWGTNPDGSGASPLSFTSGYQQFSIRNRPSITLDAPWTVSGTASQVMIDNTTADPVTIGPGNALNADVSVSGYLIVSNPTPPNIIQCATGSTVEFKDITVTVPQVQFYHLVLSGSGTKTWAPSNYFIAGDLSYRNTTLDASNTTVVQLNGHLSYEGTVTEPADDHLYTLNFGGFIGIQNITGNGHTIRVYKLATVRPTTVKLSATGGTSNLQIGNSTGGSIELADNSVLDLNGNSLNLTSGNATLNPINFHASGAIKGHPSSTVFIDGSGAVAMGPIRFLPTANTLSTFYINHTGAIKTISLGSDLHVSNLDLVSGIISLGNNNLSLSGTLVGGGASAYVRTNGTGSYTVNSLALSSQQLFPVGNSTYNPVYISSTDGLNWSVNVADAVSNVANPSRYVQRSWNITPSGTPGFNEIRFEYNDGDPSQIGAAFNSSEAVHVLHYNGGWNVASPLPITPTGSAGSVRTVNLSDFHQFSPFTIANVNGVLPVRFTTLKATQKQNGVQVDWSNLTETDVINYTIERSNNGRSFASIGVQNAKKNDGSKADYQQLDAMASGDLFYRIKATEISGKTYYSNIVRINTAAKNTELVLYPNPVQKGTELNLQVSNLPAGVYNVSVFNTQGMMMSTRSLNHSGGALTQSVSISNLSPGVYHMRISGSTELQKDFIVQ